MSKNKRRSGEAVAAMGRKAGPMKHRLEPRGGARDDQSDYLDEYNPYIEYRPYTDTITELAASLHDFDTLVDAVSAWRDAKCDNIYMCDGANHLADCPVELALQDLLAVHNALRNG
jgi:hypothetical protein